MTKMVDLILNIDSLILKDDESVDDVIDVLRNHFSFGYEPTWEVLYEEIVDD